MTPTKFFMTAAAAAAASAIVFFVQGAHAQTDQRGEGRDRAEQMEQDHQMRHDEMRHDEMRHDEMRHDEMRRDEARHDQAWERANWHGAGPNHEYRRVAMLPSQWRGNQYRIDDWQARHLRRPLAGQYWVRSGDDFILVSSSSGVIVDYVIAY